jgi:hypothetical protein
MAGRPLIISEEQPHDENYVGEELNLTRPLGGHMWWLSMYYTNFPPLSVFNEKHWEANKGAEFYSILAEINGDSKLSEMFVSFAAAREDLCVSRPLPASKKSLTVECMQYDGIRDCNWNFPLQGYIPKRDNHNPYDMQARRFHDNCVITLGLNAAEFSSKFMDVGKLDAHITLQDFPDGGNYNTWGTCNIIMRVGGWPYRIKKVGTFEGYGEGGHQEMTCGIHLVQDISHLWDLLEGGPAMAPTGPNGEMEVQGNLKAGVKFWAQLYDLDWLGPKRNEALHYDPTIASEKGYVWFKVADSITVPSTGKKGVKIEIIEEGVVPAWLDLNFMQVFAGDFPCGYLNEAEGDEGMGSVTVARSFGERKVVVQNDASKIIFDDPMSAQVNDFCDMGWAIFDVLFKGCSMMLGPGQGKFNQNLGSDEGFVGIKGSGPAPLAHNAYGRDEIHYTQVPRSCYPTERHICDIP